MAEKRTVQLVCDITGEPDAETVRFSLEGQDYEIELSRVLGSKLRDDLAPFIAAARKASPPDSRMRRPNNTTPARTSKEKREFYRKVRTWAAAQNPPIEVSERGRISADVLAAYAADTDTDSGGPSYESQSSTFYGVIPDMSAPERDTNSQPQQEQANQEQNSSDDTHGNQPHSTPPGDVVAHEMAFSSVY